MQKLHYYPLANTERLKTMLSIMRRVQKITKNKGFYLGAWQRAPERTEPVVTEQEAVECGSTCCILGWLAVSPEFKALGGGISLSYGSPILPTETPQTTNSMMSWRSLEWFLGIEQTERNKEFLKAITYLGTYETFLVYGEMETEKVTFDHVCKLFEDWIEENQKAETALAISASSSMG